MNNQLYFFLVFVQESFAEERSDCQGRMDRLSLKERIELERQQASQYHSYKLSLFSENFLSVSTVQYRLVVEYKNQSRCYNSGQCNILYCRVLMHLRYSATIFSSLLRPKLINIISLEPL